MITAQAVKQLREKTGAGMMDCKRALAENNADMEKATDWLRKKGLAAAAKKAGRVACEGLIGLISEGNQGSIVEVNSETDFVSRNETFQGFVKDVCACLQQKKDTENLLKEKISSDKTVEDSLHGLIGVIGENLTVRRYESMSIAEGVVCGYVHAAVSGMLGRLGVLVGLNTSSSSDAVRTLGEHIAMHVAATSPQAVAVEDLDAEVVNRERAIFTEQAKASGKPDHIIEKVVEGRLRKFYEEVVLLEQKFVMDTDKTVRQALEEVAKAEGCSITINSVIRYALGEGVDKKEDNFAEEVSRLSQ